jgi:hypothetical protein
MGLQATKGVALLLLGLLAILPVEARDAHTPLPPTAVQAETTDDGVVVSWLPPLYDGGYPVETYTVYRLDGIAWTEVGTVAAGATAFLDNASTSLTFYHVIASNQAGQSLSSEPAWAGTGCEPLVLGADLEYPFVHPHMNPDCIGSIKLLWVKG